MGTPVSNGLFEVAGGKQPKERGFNCMQLVMFLTDEIREGGDNSWEYWHGRHIEAKEGRCAYRSKCPVFARTMEKRKQEPTLFDNLV